MQRYTVTAATERPHLGVLCSEDRFGQEGRTQVRRILRSEGEGINSAVGAYVETIFGGDQGLEMMKADHGWGSIAR